MDFGMQFGVLRRLRVADAGHASPASVTEVGGRPEMRPKAASRLSPVMANGFDIIPIRILHEGRVIIRMVVGPQSRLAVVFAAGL